MKKIIAAVLAIILTLGLCVGCGTKTKKDYVIPLDIDLNSKPELNIHLQAIGGKEINNNRQTKVIEEITGYKVNYSQFSTDDNTGELNTALVSGAKYNAIKIQKADFDKMMNERALLDIRPALEKYGKDILADYYDYSIQMVSRDGGIYGIPEGGPPTKGQMNVSDCIIFRKDILMKNNWNVPSTHEEFEALLKKTKASSALDMAQPFTFGKENALIPTIAVGFDIYQQWEKIENEFKFYLERSEYKDYMNYMIGLKNADLIDLNAQTQDKAKAVDNFMAGKSIAVACSVFDIDAIMDGLERTGEIKKGSNPDNILSEVGGFLDSKNEIHTYHNGGYSYVTVIPKYMNEQAAYTIDYLNSKIKLENFKKMYIGEEGTHYSVNNKGEYTPIFPAADEVAGAASYCTGTNQRNSAPLWLCRIKTKKYYNAFMRLNGESGIVSDEQGTYNPFKFTSDLKYDGKRILCETDAKNASLTMMFEDKNLDKYDSTLATWRNGGGADGKKEILVWAKTHWDGKVKVEENPAAKK